MQEKSLLILLKIYYFKKFENFKDILYKLNALKKEK